MSTPTRIYWDTSCFISLLNSDSEPGRHEICTDILNHARNDQIEVWTSCWTIAETIRPREQFTVEPLPPWATHLDEIDKEGKKIYPGAREQLEKIWEYYFRQTRPTRILSPEHAHKIKQMFAWGWIRKIQVGPVLAAKAAEIARESGLKPSDAIHVASALARGCAVIHRWDRNFKKTDHLVPSEEPKILSAPNLFTGSLPAPN